MAIKRIPEPLDKPVAAIADELATTREGCREGTLDVEAISARRDGY